jgi:hypothetical protein
MCLGPNVPLLLERSQLKAVRKTFEQVSQSCEGNF